MSRYGSVCRSAVAVALAGVTACSTGQRSEPDVETVVSAAKPPKPPVDAAPPVDAPPVDAPPVDAPPADAPVDAGGGGAGSPAFIDACLQPGAVVASFNPTATFDANDEGVTAALNLPFGFTFYGTAHTKFWITSNGQLGFGATPGGSAFGQVTCPLPDARFTTPIVLVFSADLVGRLPPEPAACYATTGTAPNRKLVVTWKDAFFYDAWLASNVTFSATLNEGTNVIDVVIERLDAPSNPDMETGWTAVLGKQAGTSAYAFSCNQPNAPEGTVIHYNP